ncbi:MAG: tail fiber domain-containing protein, partial [Candidatus Omnitrophica bacterium]|nr:tail fiber domain-containing protein [Candidatus Omnitrophota bacterium]
FFFLFAFAEESLTITTYYPSPYGNYKSLGTHKMGIGTHYSNSTNMASLSDNNLIVEGNLGIGTPDPGAKLVVPNLGSSSGTNVVVDGSGNFYIASSSLRYKNNIRNLKIDPRKILKAQPKSFTYKTTGVKDIGYIAEDFDNLGLKDLLVYDDKGNPETVKYDRISLYLIELIKEQYRQINVQQKEIEKLRAEINKLKAK